MSLSLITPPAAEPLSVAEIKPFLRVTEDTEDTLIGDLALAARRHVEAITGLALVTQGWRLTLDQWPVGTVGLPRPPVTAIGEISVLGTDDVWQVVDPALYRLVPHHPARIVFNGVPPFPAVHLGGIRVDFTTGFGDADGVPETLKQAIRLLTAHYFERREPYTEARMNDVPQTVASLIAPWREVLL